MQFLVRNRRGISREFAVAARAETHCNSFEQYGIRWKSVSISCSAAFTAHGSLHISNTGTSAPSTYVPVSLPFFSRVEDFYVAMIKALRVLDPSDLLLNHVAGPVREYLRHRKDAVR